jgi:CBS domain-containing protein
MTDTVHIPVADAGPAVSDVMLREARAVGPATPVAEVRATFANPKVKLLLVTDGERFLGTLAPGDLPDDDGGTIEAHVRSDAPRVAPEDPLERAIELLEAEQTSRIPVVDESDRLQGLVCFNREHSAFCVAGVR